MVGNPVRVLRFRAGSARSLGFGDARGRLFLAGRINGPRNSGRVLLRQWVDTATIRSEMEKKAVVNGVWSASDRVGGGAAALRRAA